MPELNVERYRALLGRSAEGADVLDQFFDLGSAQEISKRRHVRWFSIGDRSCDLLIVHACLPIGAGEVHRRLSTALPCRAVASRALALPEELTDREVGSILLRYARWVDQIVGQMGVIGRGPNPKRFLLVRACRH